MQRRLLTGTLFAATALILTISLFFFISSIERVPMGIVLKLNNQEWGITMVDANGLAYRCGMRMGDIPTSVNEQPAATFLEKYKKTGIVFGNQIYGLTATDKDGVEKSADIRSFSAVPGSIIEQTAYLVISIIFCTVGFYVFLKKPGHQPALVLFLCGPIFALALITNAAANRAVPLAMEITIPAMITGPWLLVHFFLILPEERAWLRRSRWLILVYMLPAITLILFPIIGYGNGQPLPAFRTFRLIEISMAFAAIVIIAIYNYARAVSPQTRQQMKIIMISSITAIIPILFFNILPQTIWRQPAIPPGFSFIFFAFIPIGMGYAVVTQKLMDIDVVVRLSIIYGLISVAAAVIFAATILIIEAFPETITLPQKFLITLGLGIIAVTLFGPVKKAFEKLVDRLFYKDRYDYRQVIQSFNLALNSAKDFYDINRIIVSTYRQRLNLKSACLFVPAKSGELKASAAQGIFSEPARQASLISRLTVERQNNIKMFPNPSPGIDPELAYVVPLETEGQEQGLLCLSHKATKQNYSADDLYLIQEMASVAAIILRSAALVRDVSARDTFVSIASHELKTPLTSVIAYADLLTRRELPEEKEKRWAKQILESGRRISEIIDDLLNVSRIQSGQMVMKFTRIQPAEILKEEIILAQESSDKHEFQLKINGDLPEIWADRDKFGQIIWNLLSNAIKYSPKGGQIDLTAVNVPQERQVVISVADQGMGISPADSEALFTTFHRVHRQETIGIKGAGLGLYIVKVFTEAMGGRVWLESELDRGSVFFIALPVNTGAADNSTGETGIERKPENNTGQYF